MARETLPLSDLQCRSAKPRERDYKLFDGDGLFLLVKANGTKSWRFRYTKPTGRPPVPMTGHAISAINLCKSAEDSEATTLIGPSAPANPARHEVSPWPAH